MRGEPTGVNSLGYHILGGESAGGLVSLSRSLEFAIIDITKTSGEIVFVVKVAAVNGRGYIHVLEPVGVTENEVVMGGKGKVRRVVESKGEVVVVNGNRLTTKGSVARGGREVEKGVRVASLRCGGEGAEEKKG